MKRLVLLTLLMIPATIRTFEGMACLGGEPGGLPSISVAPPAPPAPPIPPAPLALPAVLAHDDGQALASESPFRAVVSDPMATPDRAEQDLRSKIERTIGDWLVTAGIPRSWSPPKALAHDLRATPTSVDTIEKDYGTVYRAQCRLDLSTIRQAQVLEVYNRQVAGRRLGWLGVILGFALFCLAALAGYIRADEATKGYYTNRLRLAAAGAVGAAGVLLYQMLT
jgi:hypothetical protein